MYRPRWTSSDEGGGGGGGGGGWLSKGSAILLHIPDTINLNFIKLFSNTAESAIIRKAMDGRVGRREGGRDDDACPAGCVFIRRRVMF